MREREANGDAFGGGFEGVGGKGDRAAVFVLDDNGEIVVAENRGG